MIVDSTGITKAFAASFVYSNQNALNPGSVILNFSIDGASPQGIIATIDNFDVTETPAPIGVNLSGIADSDRQFMFANAMKTSRGYGPASNYNYGYEDDPTVVDPVTHWPIRDVAVRVITLDPGIPNQDVATFTTQPGHPYKFRCKGYVDVQLNTADCTGTVENVVYAQHLGDETTADIYITDMAFNYGLTLKLLDVNHNFGGGQIQQGISDIELWRPDETIGSTFSQAFLRSLEPFSVIRAMDYLDTNKNDSVMYWADRTPKSAPHQTAAEGYPGGAPEFLIELANQTNKDLWYTLPVGSIQQGTAGATDYVAGLANLIQNGDATTNTSKLNSGLHVYVEYGNEEWNFDEQLLYGTPAANYVYRQVNAGQPIINSYHLVQPNEVNNPAYYAWRLTAHRTKEILDLFGGKSDRIRPVLASQLFNNPVIDAQLSYFTNELGTPSSYLYGIAGAPYMSLAGHENDDDLSIGAVLDYLHFSLLDTSFIQLLQRVDHYHQQAQSHNLKCLMYEAGFDYLNFFGTAQSAEAKIKSNYDPGMRALISEYLDDVYAHGTDMLVYYRLADRWGLSGPSAFPGYGLTENIANLNTPKLQAVRDFLSPYSAYYRAPSIITDGTVLQAEYFDKGPNGLAYSVSVNNNQGVFRTETSVGVEALASNDPYGGAYDVGYIENLEWLKFTVQVQADGDYSFTFRTAASAATNSDGGTLRLQDEDGTNLSGDVTVPGTGAYDAWTDTDPTAAHFLSAGTHVLKLMFSPAHGGFNVNWIAFQRVITGGVNETFDPVLGNVTITQDKVRNSPVVVQVSDDNSSTQYTFLNGQHTFRYSTAFLNSLTVGATSSENIETSGDIPVPLYFQGSHLALSNSGTIVLPGDLNADLIDNSGSLTVHNLTLGAAGTLTNQVGATFSGDILNLQANSFVDNFGEFSFGGATFGYDPNSPSPGTQMWNEPNTGLMYWLGGDVTLNGTSLWYNGGQLNLTGGAKTITLVNEIYADTIANDGSVVWDSGDITIALQNTSIGHIFNSGSWEIAGGANRLTLYLPNYSGVDIGYTDGTPGSFLWSSGDVVIQGTSAALDKVAIWDGTWTFAGGPYTFTFVSCNMLVYNNYQQIRSFVNWTSGNIEFIHGSLLTQGSPNITLKIPAQHILYTSDFTFSSHITLDVGAGIWIVLVPDQILSPESIAAMIRSGSVMSSELYGVGGVGILDNSDLGLTQVNGFDVLPHSIIVTRELLGDANVNGVVDGDDFNIWFSHMLSGSYSWLRADFNHDGIIDGADYDIWFTHLFVQWPS